MCKDRGQWGTCNTTSNLFFSDEFLSSTSPSAIKVKTLRSSSSWKKTCEFNSFSLSQEPFLPYTLNMCYSINIDQIKKKIEACFLNTNAIYSNSQLPSLIWERAQVLSKVVQIPSECHQPSKSQYSNCNSSWLISQPRSQHLEVQWRVALFVTELTQHLCVLNELHFFVVSEECVFPRNFLLCSGTVNLQLSQQTQTPFLVGDCTAGGSSIDHQSDESYP